MIKNGRQYAVTRAQVDKFVRALEAVRARAPGKGGADPALLKAEEAALRSQLADLRAELKEYETLRAGNRSLLKIATLEELPRALIQARIVAGLSQKELAERLGLKEQQIQRYEATDYASASLARLIQVSRALGLRVRASARASGSGKPTR